MRHTPGQIRLLGLLKLPKCKPYLFDTDLTFTTPTIMKFSNTFNICLDFSFLGKVYTRLSHMFVPVRSVQRKLKVVSEGTLLKIWNHQLYTMLPCNRDVVGNQHGVHTPLCHQDGLWYEIWFGVIEPIMHFR